MARLEEIKAACEQAKQSKRYKDTGLYRVMDLADFSDELDFRSVEDALVELQISGYPLNILGDSRWSREVTFG